MTKHSTGQSCRICPGSYLTSRSTMVCPFLLVCLFPINCLLYPGPYIYELPFQFERNRAIRSHTGYVGLRNLSNTCYLNSLFTQLFMNIPFREFMLEAYVADGGASQKLLSETQNLFSYMQNSLRR